MPYALLAQPDVVREIGGAALLRRKHTFDLTSVGNRFAVDCGENRFHLATQRGETARVKYSPSLTIAHGSVALLAALR
ncbi:MAG: hypothetical protein K8S22_14845 [Betaproteobacteria bacterium]|nr:hypothetical protein [Betaproteobacteria bacterium]